MLSEIEGDGEYRRLAIACELPMSPSWRAQVNAERMCFTNDVSKGPRSPSAWQGDAIALSSNSKWVPGKLSQQAWGSQRQHHMTTRK
jgi:hypothetical protein